MTYDVAHAANIRVMEDQRDGGFSHRPDLFRFVLLPLFLGFCWIGRDLPTSVFGVARNNLDGALGCQLVLVSSENT